MLRYAVVGSGAVGCFYGIRLAHAGADVQFLFRHDADDVRAHGLWLESPTGDIELSDVVVSRGWAELAPCDVLLVAAKATANEDILRNLREHIGRLLAPGGVVLLVQNGIGAEPAFAELGQPVFGGLAFLCAQRTGPHTVRHLDFGELTIAAHTADEAPGGITQSMRAIASDLAVAGTPVRLDEDLIRARWRKLMWNIPFNPLSVILDATTDELVSDPATSRLIARIMDEVAAVARVEGYALPDDLPRSLIAATVAMTPYATSMKLDAAAGRPLEVDVMLGAPLRRASRVGVAMPAVAVLHDQLAFLDRRGHQEIQRGSRQLT